MSPARRSASSKQKKAKKIVVFKMKRRKGYKRTQGHRTQQTHVRVKSINS